MRQDKVGWDRIRQHRIGQSRVGQGRWPKPSQKLSVKHLLRQTMSRRWWLVTPAPLVAPAGPFSPFPFLPPAAHFSTPFLLSPIRPLLSSSLCCNSKNLDSMATVWVITVHGSYRDHSYHCHSMIVAVMALHQLQLVRQPQLSLMFS